MIFFKLIQRVSSVKFRCNLSSANHDGSLRRMVRYASITILALASVIPSGKVLAQDNYPNRPLKLVVGFPPGGSSDATGRLLAAALSEKLGQPVVV